MPRSHATLYYNAEYITMHLNFAIFFFKNVQLNQDAKPPISIVIRVSSISVNHVCLRHHG